MVEVASGSPAVAKKAAARVALVALSPSASTLLRECFRQMILACIGLNLTDLVAAVPPDAVANYRRFYFTTELRPPNDGKANTWSLARDESGSLLPVRVVRLAIDKVPENVLKKFLETT